MLSISTLNPASTPTPTTKTKTNDKDKHKYKIKSGALHRRSLLTSHLTALLPQR
jgi:hypothetical protein